MFYYSVKLLLQLGFEPKTFSLQESALNRITSQGQLRKLYIT